MRYGIFSDVHANLEAMEAVARACEKESLDRYLCAGDVVGYGANPGECIEIVRQLAGATVAGNHDLACAGLFSLEYFNPMAAEAILWTRKQLKKGAVSFLRALKLVENGDALTLVHGTLDEPGQFNYLIDTAAAEATFRLLESRVCFVGHTHVAGIFKKNKTGKAVYLKGYSVILEKENSYIVNTGSVGQPRDGIAEAAYCVYDTGKGRIEIKRVPYDTGKAREKIIAAGLPQYLGDRLLSGS